MLSFADAFWCKGRRRARHDVSFFIRDLFQRLTPLPSASVDFTSEWLSFWLLPLLENPLFNDNRTLILLTFDETESKPLR